MKTLTARHLTQRFLIAIALFIGIAGKLHAQEQIEIVIVASSHVNEGKAADYRPVVEKLKQYNPDMVFGEFLSPADQKEAIENSYWGAATDIKRLNFLKRQHDTYPKNAAMEIKKAYKALDKYPYYHKTRMNLARNLSLTYDRANAEYQFYVLDTHMKPRFEEEEQAHFIKLFSSSDSLAKMRFIRKKSEYQMIFFPLIYELGHDRIYAADCQKYDAQWSAAWQKTIAQHKAMEAAAKADITSPAAQTVKAIEAYYQEGEKRAQGVDTGSYGFLSSNLYAEFSDYMNFYGGPKFLNQPGFPTEGVQEMLHWWGKRNEGICENIIRQAKAKGAKRIVVGIGAAHRHGMEEVFARMPDVKIINYNEL